MQPGSLLTGENAAYIDAKYQDWLLDAASVEDEWAREFERWERPAIAHGPLPGSAPRSIPRSIFAGGGQSAQVVADSEALRAARKQARVAQLVNAHRVRGHLLAQVDPLGERERVEHPELTLAYYGLAEHDLEFRFATAPLYGLPEFATLREILEHCRQSYCTFLASEYMNIDTVEQKQWVAQQIESLPGRQVLDKAEERRLLRLLCDAENFEHMLHTRFPGTKRFSLEGGETFIPLLDILIESAADSGIEEVVLGMAHRGRLNVLANTLDKPVAQIVAEFEDADQHRVSEDSGDVKYHKGYSADRTTLRGATVHVSLTPNPSHLEAVNTVVQGRVRAKQDRADGGCRDKRMAVLVHGDAAFAGQGVVAETLQSSALRAYETGGTIHIIVNNQIGFTTQPIDARSGPYASDVARLAGIPIFHVNGESPRAVAAAVKIAVQWRQTFHRDVVIDMYCYRKYGHNEGDEPGFTQPRLYKLIRGRPTPRAVYARWLEKIGTITREEAESIQTVSRTEMNESLVLPTSLPELLNTVSDTDGKGVDPDMALYMSNTSGVRSQRDEGEHLPVETSVFKGVWERFTGNINDEIDTTIDQERLQDLLRRANTLRAGFTPHRKIERLVAQRMAMAEGDRPIDWAVAEQAAWASLVDQGYRVRLSGQDCGRGTFSHRHATLTDIETNEEYWPLADLARADGDFEVWDSFLSEYAVLGFEFGYSTDCPNGLIMWEAQFGDFVNGAQIVIDQFIVSSEQKWGRFSGLVMLLPHGLEGQGPEHSSARPERFLQACAKDNMQVVNVTTPANYFHLLRRQTMRRVRKPLIVMAPKSLLRHAEAVSSLQDLAHGSFQRVIADPEPPSQVDRVVLCSGKLYYELRKARAEEPVSTILHRVEMLYPFPASDIAQLLAAHPNAKVVWCQEEPKNMGAWPRLFHWFYESFPDRRVEFVGRPDAPSPAGGSHRADRALQTRVIRRGLGLS